MWIFCREILTIIIAALVSGTVVWIVVRAWCLHSTAKLKKEIKNGLPGNGNGPPLSALIRGAPRDTGTFKKIED